MPDKKYLSAQEVAQTFGPSRHTLLKWETEGAITPARVGNGQRRYDRDQIEALLKQAPIKPPPIAVSTNGSGPVRPDFREYGVSGLNRFSGSLYEEKLRELRGRAGRIKYSEMRRNSATVAAVFFGLVNALKQPSVRAKPASDSIPDQKAALWLETCLQDMSFSWMDTLDLILQPLFEQGFTLLELVYKRRLGVNPPPYTESPARSKYQDGKNGWRKWAPRPAESLADGQEWIYDAHGGLQGINQQPDTMGGFVKPLVNYPAFRDIEGQESLQGIYSIPIEKLLHFRTTLHPANSPEGMSLLRPMYLSYHYATNLSEIEGIGAERDLAGIPVMYLGEGTTLSGADSDYEEAKALVVNLRNDEQTGIVIPHPKMGTAGEGRGVLLELLSTGGRRNWDVGSIIERYEKRMAMSCLAQFIMLGMQSVGSYALSRHQGDLFVLAATAFLQSVADVINRHAVPRLFSLNAFPGITGYPELAFSPVGIPDLEAVSDFVNKLVERQVLTPDAELERHLRQLGGLPAPVISPSTLHPPSAPGNPPWGPSTSPERGVEETALLIRRLTMALEPLQELMLVGGDEAKAMLRPLIEDLKQALGTNGTGEGFEEAQVEAEGQMRGAIREGEKVEAAATQYVALMKNWEGFRDALAIFKAKDETKVKAKDHVAWLVRSGKKPPARTLKCRQCGKQAEEYHHHKGYAKEHWEDVIPLCRSCQNKKSNYSDSVKKNLTIEDREWVEKFNPWHDERERFTGPGGAGGVAGQGGGQSGAKKPDSKPTGGAGSGASEGEGGQTGSGGDDSQANDFPKDDKELKSHYDLKSNCKGNGAACKGIKDYTDDDASLINGHLRGTLNERSLGGEIARQNKLRNIQETTKNLDKAFEVMPKVPANMMVARFVSKDLADQLKPGTVFRDKGFVSTTINKHLKFESYDGKSDWKIHINVSKGSKGIYVKDKSTRPNENELLLPRGSRMRITHSDPATKTVYADYLSD